MHSQTEENHLKAIFNLANEKGEVGINELSKHLNVKMPSVNSMMKKLAEKGLVHYQTYKPIRLTQKGEKEAALIIRKHRLTEMYLVEKMGFGWDEVHDIAEQVEHIQSPAFFEKMDELLGFPKIDPHGSPIPDEKGKMEWAEHLKLSDCKAGETVTVAAVDYAEDEFLRFLNNRELKLGVEVKIEQVESFDGSMVVSYGKRTNEVLSYLASERLLVKKN